MSTHQEAPDPMVPPADSAAEDALTWDATGMDAARGPVRRAAGLVARHWVISASIAAFAVAVIVVSLLSRPPAALSNSAKPSYPAAHGFTVTELGHPGTKISLSQYKGKPLVLNFWASWCEPCQKESPLLASWYKQQHGHVNMIGFDENDNAAKALAFAHAKGMTYPLAFDPRVNVASKYSVVALPQTFFLNAQHHIVDHVVGGVTKAKLAKGLRLMNAS